MAEAGDNHYVRPKAIWSPEEDEKLASLIKELGITSWTKIASELPGRTGKQCRERWHNHLDSGIKKGQWSVDEDTKIIAMQLVVGNQWSKITKMLPGRTDNAVKNRFHVAERAKNSGRGTLGQSLEDQLVTRGELLEESIMRCARSVQDPDLDESLDKYCAKWAEKNGGMSALPAYAMAVTTRREDVPLDLRQLEEDLRTETPSVSTLTGATPFEPRLPYQQHFQQPQQQQPLFPDAHLLDDADLFQFGFSSGEDIGQFGGESGDDYDDTFAWPPALGANTDAIRVLGGEEGTRRGRKGSADGSGGMITNPTGCTTREGGSATGGNNDHDRDRDGQSLIETIGSLSGGSTLSTAVGEGSDKEQRTPLQKETSSDFEQSLLRASLGDDEGLVMTEDAAPLDENFFGTIEKNFMGSSAPGVAVASQIITEQQYQQQYYEYYAQQQQQFAPKFVQPVYSSHSANLQPQHRQYNNNGLPPQHRQYNSNGLSAQHRQYYNNGVSAQHRQYYNNGLPTRHRQYYNNGLPFYAQSIAASGGEGGGGRGRPSLNLSVYSSKSTSTGSGSGRPAHSSSAGGGATVDDLRMVALSIEDLDADDEGIDDDDDEEGSDSSGDDNVSHHSNRRRPGSMSSRSPGGDGLVDMSAMQFDDSMYSPAGCAGRAAAGPNCGYTSSVSTATSHSAATATGTTKAKKRFCMPPMTWLFGAPKPKKAKKQQDAPAQRSSFACGLGGGGGNSSGGMACGLNSFGRQRAPGAKASSSSKNHNRSSSSATASIPYIAPPQQLGGI